MSINFNFLKVFRAVLRLGLKYCLMLHQSLESNRASVGCTGALDSLQYRLYIKLPICMLVVLAFSSSGFDYSCILNLPACDHKFKPV